MQRKLIFFLFFMVLITVFALQNSSEVSIKLWFWDVQTSMALILILTFAAGAIAGLLFSIPRGKKKEEPALQAFPGQSPGSEKPAEQRRSGEKEKGNAEGGSAENPDKEGNSKFVEFEDV